ncbi:MAG: winged helix-turn-helix domain-containing protein [Chloroflexi bacterium]|nr:winged helix-turn-helix domain-containing protein [Chloroflexota bacterium]
MTISEHTQQAAVELSETVRAVAGFSASVTLLQSENGSNLVPAGHSRLETGGWKPGDSELTEQATGDGPGARALTLGVTLVFSEGDNPGRSLPGWATSRGFATAVLLPLIKHGRAFGVVYIVRRDPQRPSAGEIHMAELAVVHGGRTLPVLVRRQDETEDEDEAGYSPGAKVASEPVRNLAPLLFEGLRLDPVREQARLGGVDVSLSRTEFLMLYTLGRQANEVVPHHALLAACWAEDIPALSAVDATVYRLRKKLSQADSAAGKQMLKTVRGKGYLLAAGPDAGE